MFRFFFCCEKATRWGIFAAAMIGPERIRMTTDNGFGPRSGQAIILCRIASQGYPLQELALVKESSSVCIIDSYGTGPFHPTNAQRARFVWFLLDEYKVRIQRNMAIGTILYIKCKSSSKDFDITYIVKRKSQVSTGIRLQIPDSSRLGNLSASVYIHNKWHLHWCHADQKWRDPQSIYPFLPVPDLSFRDSW